MLDLFKAQLKAKAKALGANLSQKRIDAYADKLHAQFPDITDEAEHTTEVDKLADLVSFKEVAAFDDYERTKKAKQKEEKQETQDGGEEKKQSQDDDTPAWVKAIIDSNKQLADKVNALENKDRTQSLQAKVASHDKLKGIPQSFLKKSGLPQSEDDLDSFVDGVVADWDTVKKEAGITLSTKPVMGNGTDVDTVDPEVKAFIQKNRKPEKT